MAKAKKAPARSAPELPEDDEIATGVLDDMGDDEQESDVIAELRSLGAGDGYRYTVSRVARKPGETGGYCAQYSAGDLSLDAIREQFGGGKYRIRVIDERGQYAGNRTVEIVDLPKAAMPAAPAAPPPAPSTDLSGIAAIIAAMRPQVAPDSGTSGVLQMILAMVDSQGKMFQAMMTAQKADPVKLTDLLALINASKTKGGNDEGAVSMLLKGLELGKELSSNGDTSALDVAREGLHMLAPLVERERAEKAAAPSAPALPRPGAAAPQPGATSTDKAAPPQGEPVGIVQQINWLRAQLKALVLQASRGKDPELYAEVMLDNLPDFITPEEIKARLSDPGAIDQLASLDARVREYRPWFEEFQRALIAFLDPEGDAENQADVGDGGDATAQ